MKINEAKIEVDNIVLHMVISELENAVIIFLFENVEKLGTLAIALPRMGVEKAGLSNIGVK